MYLDSGWKPPQEPPPRRPPLTKRQEQVFLWILAVNALLLLIAPIGGMTILHPLSVMLKSH